MIIEIIGPTGVGKSFLALETIKELQKVNIPVIAIHEQWNSNIRIIPDWIKNPATHNIITDIKITLWSLHFFLFHIRFTCFIMIKVIKAKCPFQHKICIARGLWRKCGMDSYFRRKQFNNYCIIIDEGICHSIHNFLVFPDSPTNPYDIKKYAKLIPLPDILVFISGTKEQLMENLNKRGVLSPRVKNPKELLIFVTNSIKAFKLLMKESRLSLKTINLYCKDSSSTKILVNAIKKRIIQ